ncbi:hypothetical protein NQ314_014172 [Rhamnusium bicolor]|uniref:FKRP stem domain-containing protein n=1 Tax=Rhamnusium bicolor TaxID=1586634 RepID=A0AAV8X3R2_9CUCU|nr:hypothetical protein NQ314_014172 [Rhamnusium bicolor]
MRLKLTKSSPFFVVLIFLKIVMLYFTFRLFISFGGFKTENIETTPRVITKNPLKHISKLVTVIIREFELYENDVTLTAHSFINIFPTIQLFIIYDELPYPPLDIMLINNSLPNVKFISLSPSLKTPFAEHYPISQIKTKYVLFVPDSTRLTSRQSLQLMINELGRRPGNMVVAPVSSRRKDLNCLRINVTIREWTLKYSSVKSLECDGVSGKHILLLETDMLKRLSNAFILPFPQSLYIQTTVLNSKIYVLKGLSFHEGKPVLRSHHAQWKQKRAIQVRMKKFYELFKIKQVVRETGTIEWYGCTKDTVRCFGTVFESMPSYLFEKKWTPPCCLSNLRKTARHVFNSLDEAGVRYWLEAGSLLEDLSRCAWLKKAKDKPVVDPKGFLWEKATEGNFYHVHYSKSNKIHVNLFPFYSKNGTVTKDSWFTNHKNMEFPDNFLHPMSSIDFIGRSVPSPNNIRDFLELKFGKGSIENPEYPDPSKLKFP